MAAAPYSLGMARGLFPVENEPTRHGTRGKVAIVKDSP